MEFPGGGSWEGCRGWHWWNHKIVANGGGKTNASSLNSTISEKPKVEKDPGIGCYIEKNIPSNIIKVPGTLKLHQVWQSEYFTINV